MPAQPDLRHAHRLRGLWAYVLLAYGLTWLVMLPWVLVQRGLWEFELPDHWEVLGAFGPFLAALLVSWRVAGSAGARDLVAGLTRWRVALRWRAVTLLSPLVILMMAVLAAVLSGSPLGLARVQSISWLSALGLLDLVIAGALLQSLGEEPGWRGFMLPRLRARYGPLASTAVLAPVWILWHLPAFLGRPEFGAVQLLGLALGLAAAAAWLTLIYEATGSLLMAVLWHALINVARGIALAISSTTFVAFSSLVLASGVVIVGYWLLKRPAAGPSA
jgi:membrane protease YdiL (CAAX protease family)